MFFWTKHNEAHCVLKKFIRQQQFSFSLHQSWRLFLGTYNFWTQPFSVLIQPWSDKDFVKNFLRQREKERERERERERESGSIGKSSFVFAIKIKLQNLLKMILSYQKSSFCLQDFRIFNSRFSSFFLSWLLLIL